MKTKSIKNIKVGDHVQSYNFEEDQMVSAKVTEIFKHKDVPGVKIIINKDLIATGNHPLYINDKYQPAAKARIGDIVIDPDGIEVKIHTLAVKPMKIDVYNIEVEGDHNYFAGGMLNHNKCGDYVGDDEAMEAQLGVIEEAADVYQSSLQNSITNYYDQVEGLIGSGGGTATDLSYVDLTGATQTYAAPTLGGTTDAPGAAYSEQTSGGGLSTWGAAVAEYTSAATTLEGARESAATKMIAAEEGLDIVEESVSTTLETTGEKIAGEAEGALQEIQATTGGQGFAATGLETMMKKDIRTSQGTAWSEATDAAQENLASAISDYESAMGSGETTSVGGVETADVGSIMNTLQGAENAMIDAETGLKEAEGNIQTSLSQERAAFVGDLDLAKRSFTETTSTAYGQKNIENYISSPDSIISGVEGGLNTHLFGDAGGDFRTADWNEFGFAPAGAAVASESDEARETGKNKGFLWLSFGKESCLEGNVKVVIGDKNGSN